MLAVRSSTAGTFTFSSLPSQSLDGSIYVKPFGLTDHPIINAYSEGPATESVCDLITAFLRAQSAQLSENRSTNDVTPEVLDQCFQMTIEMDCEGWLTNDHYSIAHQDLAPRNILVNNAAEVPLAFISAVLDWDSAILAPMFMSCRPPVWIWVWQNGQAMDERTANDVPSTPEGQELKALFEEAAGPDYVKLAYKSGYRLARRLFRFTIDGIRSNEDLKEAVAMLKEWRGMDSEEMLSHIND